MFDEYAPLLTDDDVRTPTGRAALAALREFSGDVGALAGADDPNVAAAASALAVEPIEGEPTREYASHVFARLQEFVLKAKSDDLRIRLQKLNPQTEAGYDELFHELVAADGELRRSARDCSTLDRSDRSRVGAAARSVHSRPCSRRSWMTPVERGPRTGFGHLQPR